MGPRVPIQFFTMPEFFLKIEFVKRFIFASMMPMASIQSFAIVKGNFENCVGVTPHMGTSFPIQSCTMAEKMFKIEFVKRLLLATIYLFSL